LWWALGGFLLSLVLAVIASLAAESLALSLLLSIAALDAGLVLTVWAVTRRYGTGSVVDDLGLRFTRHDVAGGLAAGVAARSVAGAMAITVLWVVGGDVDSVDVQFDTFESDDAALSLALFAAVFIAPFVEEIFFRGLLQGVLTQWIGVPAGIGVQSVLFALIHYQGDATAGANLVLMAAVGVGGAVFGVAYQLTGRLGSAVVGHAVFNLIASILILFTR
jgi:membrane protease YdiL (CAAX protease family)